MTESVEREFLDGTFVIPDYLDSMMAGIDTTQVTYQRAVDLANQNMLNQHVGRHQQTMVRDHFERMRDGTDS